MQKTSQRNKKKKATSVRLWLPSQRGRGPCRWAAALSSFAPSQSWCAWCFSALLHCLLLLPVIADKQRGARSEDRGCRSVAHLCALCHSMKSWAQESAAPPTAVLWVCFFNYHRFNEDHGCQYEGSVGFWVWQEGTKSLFETKGAAVNGAESGTS